MPPPLLRDYDSFAKHRDAAQPRVEGSGPEVSIVTVALNAIGTVERTIASVQAQAFPSIEHVFVDGGSTDGTLEAIRRAARSRDYWISEKDNGISDAFNKGIALARGRWILILNADDWLSPDQIALSVAGLKQSGADFVFGDLVFYEDQRPCHRYVGDPNYARIIHRRWPAVGHPTLLASRHCFEKVGLFDPVYRNAMDYDWLLRLHCAGARGAYCPDVTAHMTHDGVSNLQFHRTIEEVRQIVIAQGRGRLQAGTEARFRHFKTAVAQPIKRSGGPLYRLIRRSMNRAYKPISISG